MSDTILASDNLHQILLQGRTQYWNSIFENVRILTIKLIQLTWIFVRYGKNCVILSCASIATIENYSEYTISSDACWLQTRNIKKPTNLDWLIGSTLIVSIRTTMTYLPNHFDGGHADIQWGSLLIPYVWLRMEGVLCLTSTTSSMGHTHSVKSKHQPPLLLGLAYSIYMSHALIGVNHADQLSPLHSTCVIMPRWHNEHQTPWPHEPQTPWPYEHEALYERRASAKSSSDALAMPLPQNSDLQRLRQHAHEYSYNQ